jgi:hypothetical protein
MLDHSRFLPGYEKQARKPLLATTVVVHDDGHQAAERYREFKEADVNAMSRFANSMKDFVVETFIGKLGWNLVCAGAALARYFGKDSPHLYYEESDHFADLCGMKPGEVAFLQRMYSFSHLGSCSTLCFWDEVVSQMVCMRSLDWSNPVAFSDATRLFEHRKGGQVSHYSVGPLGMLGELTVVKPGAFSVVVNWAPGGTAQVLLWGLGAGKAVDSLFLLRALMESPVEDYEGAVAFLSAHPVAAPIFFTVCGVAKGEACTIERGTRYTEVRRIGEAKCLVQTNHYDPEHSNASNNVKSWDDAGPYQPEQWYEKKLPVTSGQRRRMIESHIEKGLPAWDVYQQEPVWNNESAYWVEMRPANTGQNAVSVWIR